MILLYLYIGVIAVLCIALAGIFLAAGIIGLASVIRAAFRGRAREAKPLWDPRDVSPAADVFMVAELARQYGVPVMHYSFEHDGPRVDPSRVSEN